MTLAKKSTIRTISSVLSIYLATSMAGGVPAMAQTMTILDDVNGGAFLAGHAGGFDGYTTDGTRADLNFSGNARLDWSKLNVGAGQELNFFNGSSVVLNNVDASQGMSRIAGVITAESGRIIISNSAGVLFDGGRFISVGPLTITTSPINLDLVSGEYEFCPVTEDSVVGAIDIKNGADIFAGGQVELVTVNGADFIPVGAGQINVEGSTVTAPQLIMTASGDLIIKKLATGAAVDAKANNVCLENSSLTGARIVATGDVTGNGNVTGSFVAGNDVSLGELRDSQVVAGRDATVGDMTNSGVRAEGNVEAGGVYYDSFVIAGQNANVGNIISSGVRAEGNVEAVGAYDDSFAIAGQDVKIGDITSSGVRAGRNADINDARDSFVIAGQDVTIGNMTNSGVRAEGDVNAGDILSASYIIAGGNIKAKDIISASVAADGNVEANDVYNGSYVFAGQDAKVDEVVDSGVRAGRDIEAGDVSGTPVPVVDFTEEFSSYIVAGQDVKLGDVTYAGVEVGRDVKANNVDSSVIVADQDVEIGSETGSVIYAGRNVTTGSGAVTEEP